jgi:hypothetical protein
MSRATGRGRRRRGTAGRRRQRFGGRCLGRGEHLVRRDAGESRPESRHPELVEEGAGSATQALECLERMTERVGHTCKAAAPSDQGAAGERAQPETLVVEQATSLRIRCEEHLEAAVEHEPVDDVGAHAAAGRVAPVEDEHLEAGGVEFPGAAEAGEAGADDDDVRHRRCSRGRSPRPRPVPCAATRRPNPRPPAPRAPSSRLAGATRRL